MNIKVPLPKQRSAFAFRRGRMSAFYAGPGFVFSGRGYNLGSFYINAPAPPLPAHTVFRGMGAFYMKASPPPLPAASVFGGMGRVRRLRGLGDMIPTTIDLSGDASPSINAIHGGITLSDGTFIPYKLDPLAPIDSSTITLTPPPGVAVDANGNPLPIGGYPTSTTPYNPASTNPQLDAFNAALMDSGAASSLNPTQLAALSAAAGKATPAQLQQATLSLRQGGSTAGSSISQSISNFFGGSTNLAGYTVKNSTLVLGGAATVIGLSLLSSLGGGKKRRR